VTPRDAAGVPEDDLFPLSALQHYIVCPRQVALIHIERQWAENAETAHGRIEHERVDEPGGRRERGVRRVTGLALRSFALGVVGRADVVEFHHAGQAPGQVVPVEHKHGKPKRHDGDRVQLCAQGMALEEMLAWRFPTACCSTDGRAGGWTSRSTRRCGPGPKRWPKQSVSSSSRDAPRRPPPVPPVPNAP
jgi:CRISPR-associated exonuclease Cas4